MNIYFINPPFKSEYGKFSRESRSPAITKSGALYYPLWLIYAMREKVFIRDGKSVDSAGVINTTNTFVEDD